MAAQQLGSVNEQVKHKYRTQKEFLQDTNKDPNAIYFTDSGNIYLGNKMMGTAINKVEGYDHCNSFPSVGVEGIVYKDNYHYTFFTWDNELGHYVPYENNDCIDFGF